jgi:hypothetical protein
MKAGFGQAIKIACLIRTAILISCCFAIAGTTVPLNAQSTTAALRQTLPYVSNMAVPFYPPVARAANLEGIVHIRVTTDGTRVVATRVEDGPKLLAEGAEKNVKTWKLAQYSAMTFLVTYRFRLIKTSRDGFIRETVILHLPSEIEVLSPPFPPLD